jgi:hypothetical protein
MKRKGLFLCVGLALLLVLTAVDAQAGCYRGYNPLYLPFAAVGAVIGTAAAITTAVVPAPHHAYPVYGGPVYPAHPVYSGPGYGAHGGGFYDPRPYYARPVWIPPHHNRYGAWIPGHWR